MDVFAASMQLVSLSPELDMVEVGWHHQMATGPSGLSIFVKLFDWPAQTIP